MLKRIILFSTMIFLLFEVVYFDSNNRLEDMKDNKDGSNIYTIYMDNNKDLFLKDYEDIILDVKDKEIIVMTDSLELIKIKEKYPVVIVK